MTHEMLMRSSARPRTPKLRFAVILAGAGLLAGCVVGPDYEKPNLLIPASWNGKKEKAPAKPPELSEWWKQLHDPVLDQLIVEAVDGNLDVATSKAKIREARAVTREQVGVLQPTLSSSPSAERIRTAASGTSDASSYSQFQAGFDASWELDLFGGNKRALEAARNSEQAANDDLRDTLLTLVGDVASYYVEAREYQALIKLAERSAKSQRQTAALTKSQVSAGEATGVDAAKADALAASTEADIPTYRISYAQSVHRLGVLLGKSPDALEARLAKGGGIPMPKVAVSTGIPAHILLARPDVRAAERRLAQYTAKVGQAEANRYPSISLTGSIATSATSIGDLAKKSTIGWSFGPTVSVPIFQGGQLKAAVDVAKAQRDQYSIAYQSSVLSAMEDVENAIVSLNQTRLRHEKISVSVAGYREAAKLSRVLNETGATAFLNVLDSERSLYTAEESLIESRTAIATYYVALNKALGGGWDGAIDVSKPVVVDTNEAPHIVAAK
jgi:multidrug efflux system outer membrane protein